MNTGQNQSLNCCRKEISGYSARISSSSPSGQLQGTKNGHKQTAGTSSFSPKRITTEMAKRLHTSTCASRLNNAVSAHSRRCPCSTQSGLVVSSGVPKKHGTWSGRNCTFSQQAARPAIQRASRKLSTPCLCICSSGRQVLSLSR